jgi:hypothetical protein
MNSTFQIMSEWRNFQEKSELEFLLREVHENNLLNEGIRDLLVTKFSQLKDATKEMMNKFIQNIIGSIETLLEKSKKIFFPEKGHLYKKIINRVNLYKTNEKYQAAAGSALFSLLKTIGTFLGKANPDWVWLDNTMEIINVYFDSKIKDPITKDEFNKDLMGSMIANRDSDDLKNKRKRSAWAKEIRAQTSNP